MLSPQEIASFRSDGCLAPVQIFREAEAHAAFAAFERAEQSDDRPGDWNDNPHLLFSWARDLVLDPRLLGAVECLIGPDILCWEADIFAKNANTPNFISWHQDVTYWGLSADQVVTAWIALTPSTVESGCMRVLPGSHRRDQVAHVDTYAKDNMLSRGQEIAVEVDERDARNLVLRPGEVSFHHVKMFHASAPNRSSQRRVGLAVRYMATSVRPEHGLGDFATLVRGRDAHNHFMPMTLAEEDLGAKERTHHGDVNRHRLTITMPQS
jgi:non-haem Fe2+, alpha-ketoglutarate-dependent halogenase